MEASSPAMEGVPSHPSLIVWQYSLSGYEIEQVDASLRTFAGCTVVGRMIGYCLLRSLIRDWLFRVADSRVSEVALLGRGVFRALLSDDCVALDVLDRSPIIADSRVIVLRLRYLEFNVEDFESRFDVPRF